ncbi:MAG: NAD-dependent epimerase/dehydratase family protein [Acidimicrobiales bacterium]|nr:MAG: NAD-dependent epimerase/dehydratase family protein [Acidimicrobiales bacterium]
MSNGKTVIALTGATGFVGSGVLDLLLEQGYQVRCLVRRGSRHKMVMHRNSYWVEGGLADWEGLGELVDGADVVLHMAGLITARTKSDYEEVNSIAVDTLARAAYKANVGRFVYLSSLAAKAPDLSLYAWSKREGEYSLKNSFPKDKSVIVRAPAVFGAEDVATAPIYACIRRGFLPAPGGRGWQKRLLSLIHVDDLAEFLAKICVSQLHDGETVSPSTRAAISWPDFAAACSSARGEEVKAIPLPLSLLYPVAGLTTLTKAITGKGHLTLGKLGEFLYDDWSVEAGLQSDTDFSLALKKTLDPK